MLHAPQKAVILAAGMGERLRPLTWVLPKPLLPLWGRPLIEHTLARLESWGVREVAVNLHWLPNLIQQRLAAWSGPARLTFSHEPVILGTGGALLPLRRFLGDEPFWLVNADIAFSLPPAPLMRAFVRSGGWAAAWLDPRRGPRTVETDAAGRIVNFRSTRPGTTGTATFCGLQLLSPQIMDHLPSTQPACSILSAYEHGLAEGRHVAGVTVPGSYWNDAGTLHSYLATHAEVKRRFQTGRPGGELYDATLDQAPARGRTFCCQATDARLTGGARSREVVLWPGSQVHGRRTRLVRTVVAGAAWPVSSRDVSIVPAASPDEPAMQPAVAAMGWPLAETSAVLMGERGSNRRFWRLACGDATSILICYTCERAENARYAAHARLLAEAGVPVPRVLADLPAAHALVLEDWGECSLETRMRRSPAHAATLYAPVLAAAARLHTDATALAIKRQTVMEPAFDATVFHWEHELFARYLVRDWMGRTALPPDAGDELTHVASRLQTAPRVVVHRDFQSTNVLCRGRRIALIDFQGMRLGPAAYDLASLLYDPYVALTPGMRSSLLQRYAADVPGSEPVVALFPWAAVQRLTQALGAYGRLNGMGLTAFARHIRPAATRLGEMARACGLPAMAALSDDIAAHADPEARMA
jgi:aminoglycoside/choline kinase family phosphotransferase/dTDP-glucose pyrophosphorylase